MVTVLALFRRTRADGHGAVLRFAGCGHGIAREEEPPEEELPPEEGFLTSAAMASSIAFRHSIHFGLLGNVLATGNGIDGSFHSGEILVVILLQRICLGDGCIDLGVVGILVLQGGNGIFDSFRHVRQLRTVLRFSYLEPPHSQHFQLR